MEKVIQELYHESRDLAELDDSKVNKKTYTGGGESPKRKTLRRSRKLARS
jgi:hypothetical protein